MDNHTKTFDRGTYEQKLVEQGYTPEQALIIADQYDKAHGLPKAIEKIETALELPPQQSKFVDTATEIYDVSGSKDMAFVHSVFCHVGLPRSKVEGREFMRQSGAASLLIQAGYLDEGKGMLPQPIPYGVLPRLALAHVSTHAVRHRTREIPIGDSAAQFLGMMEMERAGRRYSALRKQMHALAACRLQLGFKGRTFNGSPIEQFDAWLLNKDTKQRALWPGVLVLSEHFYNSLLEGAVPLDLRALHALKGSALALDTYIWLAHRLHRIEGRRVTLRWASLREQFAQEYTGPAADKNFKDAFLTQLKKVLAVYPEAKVLPVPGGLLLLGSPPPIPPK
jgi:hypothetical protein